MNREPSTTITPPRYATKAAQPQRDPAAWAALFAAARAAFGAEVRGLTCATPARAWFQIVGDPTFYSVALKPRERDLFTFEPIMTAEQIAQRFGCTVAQVKAQHRRNAEGLLGMADKAARTGKRVNGYTAEQLQRMAERSAARGAED
jgi:hypothetical protein